CCHRSRLRRRHRHLRHGQSGQGSELFRHLRHLGPQPAAGHGDGARRHLRRLPRRAPAPGASPRPQVPPARHAGYRRAAGGRLGALRHWLGHRRFLPRRRHSGARTGGNCTRSLRGRNGRGHVSRNHPAGPSRPPSGTGLSLLELQRRLSVSTTETIPFTPDLTVKPEVVSFFDEPTNTISYIVRDPKSDACAVIDSVMDFDYASGHIAYEGADRIIEHIRKHNWKLEWLIETHVHADHLSAAPYIQGKLGGKLGIGDRICVVQDTFGKI